LTGFAFALPFDVIFTSFEVATEDLPIFFEFGLSLAFCFTYFDLSLKSTAKTSSGVDGFEATPQRTDSSGSAASFLKISSEADSFVDKSPLTASSGSLAKISSNLRGAFSSDATLHRTDGLN
jgi:hypothetical protein